MRVGECLTTEGRFVLVAIILFFLAHWWLSVFFQSFFLHRYCAHRMFTMSKGWERFFYLCTVLFQGSSFLSTVHGLSG